MWPMYLLSLPGKLRTGRHKASGLTPLQYANGPEVKGWHSENDSDYTQYRN
jgi:hypothetical protein